MSDSRQPAHAPSRRGPSSFRDARLASVDNGEVVLYGDGELSVDIGDGWVSHRLSATDARELGAALLLIAARRGRST